MPMLGSMIRKIADMDADKVRFKGQGKTWTVTNSTTQNLETVISEERLLEGAFIILHNHARGDYMHFEIVDKDDILGYGANTILDRFVDTWYVDASIDTQRELRLPYIAFILAGLYLRVIYTSVGGTDVDVKLNFLLHKPMA